MKNLRGVVERITYANEDILDIIEETPDRLLALRLQT